jgi:nitric oxide reductase NorD protein
MSPVSRENITQLREELVKNLTVDFFEADEIESILREINSFDRRLRQKILALCRVLSSASSNFVPNTLKRTKAASIHLPLKDLDRWIIEAFDILDSEGFDSFVQFTSQTDEEALQEFQNPKGISLHDVSPVLEAFLRGLSGMELKIKPGEYAYTDTASIYLPEYMDRFRAHRKNFLLYKISIVHKWAQISQGTLTPDEQTVKSFLNNQAVDHPDIGTFFSLFPDRNLALDIYNMLESMRFDSYLYSEFPGLMKRTEKIRSDLFEERPPVDSLSDKTAVVEGLYQYYLKGKVRGPLPAALTAALEKIPFQQAYGPEQSMHVLAELYPEVSRLDGDYELKVIPAFLGRIEPEKISDQLQAQRRAHLEKIRGMISDLIDMPGLEPQERPSADVYHEKMVEPQKEYLLIRGKLIEANDEIRDLMRSEKGIPGGTLVEGSAVGGGSAIDIAERAGEMTPVEPEERRKSIRYDEWDYRRGGYKRNWCSLFEHDIHPIHEPFVELTLQRYGGYVNILRKRFELLKREPKLLRRQTDGDHIDLDATVEAFADIHAGLCPTENLFMRLDRQERNIAVLFLLDMSGSTKGWVNQAEKESLVLMCEALESLDDRYAIYGFSGMTRTRCDYFRIKGFDELYGEDIKMRIAGIQPKDYTRMGPPIRHSISILNTIEARTKLLITLSDGKPEDWDAYKGEYGIEDTRKALVEAKEQGIHSFCITIDEEAGTYLPHMYGEANYIVIDEVKKLPNRITEIYRRLTT